MRGTGGMLLPSPGRSKRENIGPLGARGIPSATPGFPLPINVSGCTSRHVYPTERASGPDPVQSHVAANLCISRYIVLRESLRETPGSCASALARAMRSTRGGWPEVRRGPQHKSG